MYIKNKKSIQAALDSLESVLEKLEDQEEYKVNDTSLEDIWDIWEEASHQLGMSDDTDELKHFADGFHDGDWERDMLVNGYDIDRNEMIERNWPGLDQILKDMDIPEEWESVKTLTWDEFTKKYGSIKTEVTESGGYTTLTPQWIYESPDGRLVYRRKDGSTKRQLKYLHTHSGPPYSMANNDGEVEWIDEDKAKQRHWYKDYIRGTDESDK